MTIKKKDEDRVEKSSDADKDAVDTLPLSSIPLSSNALKNARLVKNARLETAIELYSDPLTGSLQITPDTVSDFMETSPRDQEIIKSLAGLHSFDVYSLRTNLKKLGVEIKDADALELSDDMKEKLSIYSLEFTRPLVEKIFGKGRPDLNTKEGLQSILRDTDIMSVKENLKVMAEKTGIPLADIPKFLEEYSSVFLSVAYYRYSFFGVGPDVGRFLVWMQEVKSSRDVASSPKTLLQCKQVMDIMQFLSNSLKERLALFQNSFEQFWKDINRDSFQQMRKQIEENHGSMGPVLCGFVVKMSAWKKEFPDNTLGGPVTRTKYVLTELEPGITRLRDMEMEARRRLNLPAIKI